MRRNLSGLLLALVICGVSALLVRKHTPRPIVPSSRGVGYTSSDRPGMVWYWETHPSPLKATDEFNAHLQRATQYMEFTPCFDRDGRRNGERAVLYVTPPHTSQPTWRIMWTQQGKDFSELFTVESTSLSEARSGETAGQDGWKKCVAIKQSSPLI